jgi:chromosome segregation ATPase
MEDDEDDDIVRSSPRLTPTSSDSSKRARTNGIDCDTPAKSSEEEDAPIRAGPRRPTVNGITHGRSSSGSGDDDNAEAGKFQPGAIVRVKLTNFVTYANAEFFPGPNLNMIIGPNGTGKSSLVCAICLGLGWNPNVLGRASQINEFVKHNSDAAYVEIELQRRNNEPENDVVRLKIIRDGNGREWFLNGRKTSLKAVQTLTKSLSIQIDNLCQFLPQDKVSEFAALSPVELLLQTQRAAAPEQMLEWHEELKMQRKEQKQYEEQLQRDKEHLESLETRQDNLRAEVQRLEERNQIQKRVDVLKKTVPFVEYRDARAEHIELKVQKKEAQSRLRDLRRQVDPTLRLVNHKEEYASQIRSVITERKEALQRAEKAADECLKAIEEMGENVQEHEQKMKAEREAEKKRKNDYARLEKKVSDLKARANLPEPTFNASEFNERIVSFRRTGALDCELYLTCS